MFTITDRLTSIRFQTSTGSLSFQYTASRVAVGEQSYESSQMDADNASKTVHVASGSDTDLSAKLSVTDAATSAFVYCQPVR